MIFIALIIAGCECDQICEESKVANAVFDNYKSDTEVIDYLNSYAGEAPGAAKYSAFVIWGVYNQNKFLRIMNNPQISQRNIDLVAYQISDMGLSNSYCKIYEKRTATENDLAVRSRLLGCKFGL